MDFYKAGLEMFPVETSLLTGIARIYEVSIHVEYSIYSEFGSMVSEFT